MAKPNRYKQALERRIIEAEEAVEGARFGVIDANKRLNAAVDALAILRIIKCEAEGRSIVEPFKNGGTIAITETADVPTQAVSLDTKPRRQRRKRVTNDAIISQVSAVVDSVKDLLPPDEPSTIEPPNTVEEFPEIPDNLRRVPRREVESDV